MNKNTIIISLNEEVSEIIDLADSLGYRNIKTFIQNKKIPDVNSYIGSGKVEEIKEFIDTSDKNINLAIIDGELKPSQWFNLEKKIGIDVYDRIRLILAIFEKRADKKEAKLQVKLAQLQYERPFVREIIHRARAGEHPGFMAGGEYQVDDYYEMIKKQMKKIKEQLNNIRIQRKVRRKHRHGSGFYLASLAGYTNAGKSSLLNLLSDEKVKVEGKLFSTLSTTTRRISKNSIPILITDTVGFIQNLPAYIIDAFHSTLEEIEEADLVLLIIDISENEEIITKKLKVSLDELLELGVNSPVIIILNKTDTISDEERNAKVEYLKNKVFLDNKKIIAVSIKDNTNIDTLLELIYRSLPRLVKFCIKLPINEETQSFISWIYEKANVTEITYDEYVNLEVECNSILKSKIITKCKKLKGYQVMKKN
jgi:GTP-binding protein HflX